MTPGLGRRGSSISNFPASRSAVTSGSTTRQGEDCDDQPSRRHGIHRRADQALSSAELAVWRHYGLEPSERFIQVESPAVRVRIQEVGSGEPIVFVHGGLWPAAGLAPLVRELAGYRCILLDRPGCGLSSPVDWRNARAPDRCPERHARRRRCARAGADPRRRPFDRWRLGAPARPRAIPRVSARSGSWALRRC